MWCLGLGGSKFHDASACLFHDNQLVFFVEEERLSRIRHAIGQLPFLSVLSCLDFAGITLKDIDIITFSWNPYYPNEIYELSFDDPAILKIFPETVYGLCKARIFVIDHQLSHASSAFRTSGFKKAIVISADGSGDGKSLAVYRGENNQLIPLKTYDSTQSLGWFFQRITSYLGLGNWQHAGKTMALAALGEPCFNFDFFSIDHDGFHFNYEGIKPVKETENLSVKMLQSFYRKHKSILYGKFKEIGVLQCDNQIKIDRMTGNRIYRHPTHKMCNLAASAQLLIEKALLSVVKKYTAEQEMDSVCIAGGVAMNCKAIGELSKNVDNVKQIYVPPFAGDMGGAIGSVLEVLSSNGLKGSFELRHAFWGHGFEDEEIQSYLKHLGISSQYIDNPSDCAAEIIGKGKIIGWYQGRMEIGPRALGNRSILAKADEKAIADYINIEIKNRETWRPFSPSTLESFLHEAWHLPEFASEYMTTALQGKDNLKNLEGIRHFDNTSRVQKVNPEYSERFAALIERIGQIATNPVVLNTSLNLRNMPVVCKPAEAVQVFFSTPIDALIIGRNLLLKDKIFR